MSGTVDDKRTNKTDPVAWLVATDRVLSNWRHGPRKSYVAYPVTPYNKAYHRLLAQMEGRSDFIRVRLNYHLPRVPDDCHLTIYDNHKENES